MRSAFVFGAGAALIVVLLLALPLPLAAQALPLPDPQIVQKLTAVLEEVRREEPLVSDAFSRNQGGWQPDGQEGISWSFAGRALHAVAAPGLAGFANTPGVQVGDLLAEVDVTHAAATDAALAGIVFHYVDGDNYCAFAQRSDGAAALLCRSAGATATLLELPPQEEDLAPGEPSRLGVFVYASQVVLLVEDEIVGVFPALTPAAGDVGLFVAGAAEEAAELVFDDFELWDLAPLADKLVGLLPPASPATSRAAEAATVDLALLDAIRNADPLISSSFTRPSDSLPAGEDGPVARTFVRRAYHMAGLDSGLEAVSLLQDAQAAHLADFLLEVSLAQWEGTPGNRYGLVFRCQDEDNCYRFLVNGRGEYALEVGVDGERQTLVDWTASDALLHFAGGAADTADDWANRLGVLARGEQIVLLANDAVLASLTDGTYAAGGLGLAFVSTEEGGAEVVFDDLEVWALAEPEPGFAPQPPDEPAPEPTRAPAPATPAASGDVAQTIEQLRAAEPLYLDEFARSLGLWMTQQGDFSSTAIADGALRIKLAGGTVADAALAGMTVSDFLLEVDAQLTQGEDPYVINLFYRMDAARSLYIFQVSSGGTYNLTKVVAGEPSPLLEPAATAAFDRTPGAVNRLGILALGPSMAFLVNGEIVAQVEDAGVSAGMFGLGAGITNAEATEIVFDNLIVWDATAAPAPSPTIAPQPTISAPPTAAPPTAPPSTAAPPTAALEPTAAPTVEPTPGPLTPEALHIDWSAFDGRFIVSNVRIEEADFGKGMTKAVVFDLEAVVDAGLPVYTANFWNAKGDWITASTVLFTVDPAAADRTNFMGEWLYGAFGSGKFELPASTKYIVKTVLMRLF